MNDCTSGWRSEHVPRRQLAADGLTKALQGQAHRKFVGLLGHGYERAAGHQG